MNPTKNEVDRVVFSVRQLLDKESMWSEDKTFINVLALSAKLAPGLVIGQTLKAMVDASSSLLLAAILVKELEKQGVDVDVLFKTLSEMWSAK